MKCLTSILTLFFMISSSVFAQNESEKSNNSDFQENLKIATDTLVVISTEYGDMTLALFDLTPLHKANFIKLVQEGFYDSLMFHRVIRNFMIQGGDPLSKNAGEMDTLGMGDNGYTIPAEFIDTLFHKKGALCAARTDNPEKASSGCQFYIVQGQLFTPEQLTMLELQRGLHLNERQKEVYTNVGGTPWLDNHYTVFGQVIEGMDVVDKITTQATRILDRPIKDIRMSAKLILR